MREDASGHGAYVKGDLYVPNLRKFYLYLGGKGTDQNSIAHTNIGSKGGWNFGGNGGIDTGDPGDSNPQENGAGGGGGVDLRLQYVDINDLTVDQITIENSIKSRIIVAGSGGGAVSGNTE